eukprot:5696769-Pleurochrysis_carterae.AAC.1
MEREAGRQSTGGKRERGREDQEERCQVRERAREGEKCERTSVEGMASSSKRHGFSVEEKE